MAEVMFGSVDIGARGLIR